MFPQKFVLVVVMNFQLLLLISMVVQKDGYEAVCRACKAKTGDGNPELARFTPRQLIDELRCRGYHGTLEYVQRHSINV